MKIIDAHAHLLHNHTGFDRIVESGVYEEIWLMDLSGIRLPGYELATREEVLQAAKDFKGRVSAFGFLDFDKEVSEIDRMKEMGFVGLKPYKPLHPYNHEAYYAHYQRAQELKMPILFHTGLVAHGLPWSGSSTGHCFGPDNMRPAHLAGIAEAFPELTIIGGHVGWPWIEEMEQNLYYYKNIYHDVSGYRRSIGRLNEILDRRCHDGTDRYFNDKMLFATDSFYGIPSENEQSLKLCDFWRYYFEFVGKIYYRWGREEEQEKFFYRNARNIKQCWS